MVKTSFYLSVGDVPEQRAEIDLAAQKFFFCYRRGARLMDIVSAGNMRTPAEKKPFRHCHCEFFLREKSLCLFYSRRLVKNGRVGECGRDTLGSRQIIINSKPLKSVRIWCASNGDNYDSNAPDTISNCRRMWNFLPTWKKFPKKKLSILASVMLLLGVMIHHEWNMCFSLLWMGVVSTFECVCVRSLAACGGSVTVRIS